MTPAQTQMPELDISDEQFQEIFDASLIHQRHAKNVLDVQLFKRKLFAALSQQADTALKLPECVTAWVKAEKERIAAAEAYNAAVREADKEIWPGRSTDPEYQAMTKAASTAHNLKLAMFDALSTAAPVPPQQLEAAQQEAPKPDCGHGHVYPRADGIKARCGGPGLCMMCSRDKALADLPAAPKEPTL